jgi:hypothetical protein
MYAPVSNRAGKLLKDEEKKILSQQSRGRPVGCRVCVFKRRLKERRRHYGCFVRSSIETSYPMFRTRWINESMLAFGGVGSRARIHR